MKWFIYKKYMLFAVYFLFSLTGFYEGVRQGFAQVFIMLSFLAIGYIAYKAIVLKSYKGLRVLPVYAFIIVLSVALLPTDKPVSEHIFDVPLEVTPIPSVETVFVTKSGSRYHNENCSSVKNEVFEIPLSEAIYNGLTSCKKCGG